MDFCLRTDAPCVRLIRCRLTLRHGRHYWPPRRGTAGGRENSPTEQAAEGTCKAGVYDVCIVTTDQKQTKTLNFQGTLFGFTPPLLPHSCMG